MRAASAGPGFGVGPKSMDSAEAVCAADKSAAAFCEHYGAISGADLLCRMKEVEQFAAARAEAVKNIRTAEENCEISRQNLEKLRADLLALSRKWDKNYELGAPEEPILPLSDRIKSFFDRDKLLAAEIAEVRKQMLSQRAKLADESEIAVRAQVPPRRREALEKINFKTIQEGLVYYSNTSENLHAEYTELLAALNEYRRTAENPALLRSEFAFYDERIREPEARRDAYEMASAAIERSSDALRAKISPRLSEYASPLLHATTGGRYEGMNITNRLSATYTEAGVERPISQMSGSTKQIAYLAMRLALISILYDEMPPLCFDESMSHQDAERTLSILKFLTSEHVGMQCILFTCHSREEKLLDGITKAEIIRL